MKKTISFVFIALIAQCIASPVAEPNPEDRPTFWFPVPAAPVAPQGIYVQGANGGANFGSGSGFIPAPPPTIIAPNPSNVAVTPGDAFGNGGSITITG